MAKILVVDDEPGIRDYLQEALELAEHQVMVAADGIEGAQRLAQRRFDLLLTDLKMPGIDGLQLLQLARRTQPELPVILLTAHGSVEIAVKALKAGAHDFLQKPIESPAALRQLVSEALAAQTTPKSTIATQDEIVLSYGDPVMEKVEYAIEKVAPTEATVLLIGESGTGKEVVAQKIHKLSQRAAGPFVGLNCAAISESLLESELFGHERGAFTGADKLHRGKIEQAQGGTFFLDEIGEMRPQLQAKLLRVLQERRFERVGGNESIEVDVRWLAATNRDLDAMMQSGEFREDLYHRLAVMPISLPPLRQRQHDLPLLIQSILKGLCQAQARPQLKLSPPASKLLEGYAWPGNVRELYNTLERAVILAEGARIEVEDLSLNALSPQGKGPLRSLAEIEKEAIEEALAHVGGHRKRAAQALGIGLRTLYDKIKKYQL